MATLLFTGFPSFLGRELLPRVLGRRRDAEAVCLIQDKFAATARAAVDELARAHPHPPGASAWSPATSPGPIWAPTGRSRGTWSRSTTSRPCTTWASPATLDGSGICCPPFASYAGALVSFVRRNPGVGSAPMA